jgi:hypothetical protein
MGLWFDRALQEMSAKVRPGFFVGRCLETVKRGTQAHNKFQRIISFIREQKMC